LNLDPPDLCSWVTRITGMSHWHPARILQNRKFYLREKFGIFKV
jgi:hypothetical protein